MTDFKTAIRLFDAAGIECVIFGCRCRCLGLPELIRVKRAAGRPKDLDALAELEALLEERGDHSNG